MQNGNAYIEGIDNDFWEPIREYWKDRGAVNKGLDNPWWSNVKAAYKQPQMSNEDALRFLLTLDATQWQYTNGVPDIEAVSHSVASVPSLFCALALLPDLSFCCPRHIENLLRTCGTSGTALCV